MNKLIEMKQLVMQLNKASDAYYNGKPELMTDAEFDLKLNHLAELEKEIGVTMSNSPTVNVGAPVLKEINTVKMTSKPMLSLSKVHSAKEVTEFAKGHTLIASIKLDGMSTRLIYKDGVLISANSRGNGVEGSDITEHVKHFLNVPLKINKTGIYIVDGESIIKDNDFKLINSKLSEKDKLKNSRNAVSGTLASLDVSIVDQRRVSFIVWDVIEGCDKNDYNGRLYEAEKLGFEVVPYEYCGSTSEHTIETKINIIFEISKLCELPNDGVVFRLNDIKYGDSLGQTSHHFNNGIAYKAEVQSYPTKLIDVEWTMGKTGSLCPTIITEPVEIDGSTVNRASVHNVSIFKQFGFSKGCTCYLYKANLIIPQCLYIEDGTDDYFEVPSKCPICGAPTEIRKDKDTEVLYCTSDSCKGKLLGKLTAFVSKQGMDIDGLSEQTLNLLIDRGYISSFKDIYHLSEHKTELSALPKMGARSVSKLLKSIEESRKVDLTHLITALGINLIGKSTAKDISMYCHGDVDEFTFIMNNTSLEFAVVDRVGTAATKSLDDWWTDNSEMFYGLLDELDVIKPEEKNDDNFNNNQLNGMTFVITGSMNHFKNRNELSEKIQQLGGKISGSVSAKTNVLINNNIDSNSSKNLKAKQLQIPIWTENQFVEYIGGDI